MRMSTKGWHQNKSMCCCRRRCRSGHLSLPPLDSDNCTSNKTAQHKSLVALCSLLEKNPFTRKFQRNFTARQAIVLINTELSAAGQSSNEEAASIVFLREEFSFLSMLQNKAIPLVVHVVEKAFLHGLAARDVALVETILKSRCFGLDATVVVATLERLPTGTMKDMLMSVVNKRCVHRMGHSELVPYRFPQTFLSCCRLLQFTIQVLPCIGNYGTSRSCIG